MTAREYAKLVGFEVVGRLKRMPDIWYGIGNNHHYPWWMDEDGNEYLIDNKNEEYCIITKEGHVI